MENVSYLDSAFPAEAEGRSVISHAFFPEDS